MNVIDYTIITKLTVWSTSCCVFV